jgi:CheY-like chemotaxis protein
MDIAMQGMTPEEILRRVANRNVCIIVISAVVQAEREAKRLGVQGWIQKPFGPAQLLKAIQKLKPPCKEARYRLVQAAGRAKKLTL